MKDHVIHRAVCVQRLSWHLQNMYPNQSLKCLDSCVLQNTQPVDVSDALSSPFQGTPGCKEAKHVCCPISTNLKPDQPTDEELVSLTGQIALCVRIVCVPCDHQSINRTDHLLSAISSSWEWRTSWSGRWSRGHSSYSRSSMTTEAASYLWYVICAYRGA